MRIIIDNDITIEEYNKNTEQWCRDNLTIDNPDFYKRQRMGMWTRNVPRSIQLYERHGDSLKIPFGCLREVWQMFREADEGSTYDYHITPIEGRKYTSHINLYDYQETAVQHVLSAKNGILVMPCGSGKTQCGLEIIARVSGRALWLTHTQDLMNQSMKRAEGVMDTSEGMFGTITEGKVNIGTHITFATIQTMCRLDLDRYRHEWDIIIVDECQRCAGSPTRVSQFYKVVNNLSARYKIGLTATPKRSDGLEKSMFALLGSIIYEVPKECVRTCPVRVQSIETGWVPDLDRICKSDGTIDYSKVVEDMTSNPERFEVVTSKISEMCKGQPTIVLANRVEYLKTLCKAYNNMSIGTGICLSGMGQSKKAKEERKKALEALNTGEIHCIFATFQLAREGIDIPNLRYVVFATPEKDPTTVTQSAGRVARVCDGKEYGTVIDFVDDFGMYRSWAKKRKNIYKNLKYFCE